MSDKLFVDFFGLELSSPVVVGACPLTKKTETVRQLIQAGAGAIVLPSMLQEQIVHRRMKSDDPLGARSRSGDQPQQDHYNGGAEPYLRTIEDLRRQFTVPIIANSFRVVLEGIVRVLSAMPDASTAASGGIATGDVYGQRT